MIVLQFRIAPNGSRNEILGLFGDAIKVRVQAPPVDGKANEALLKYLGTLVPCALSKLELVRGHKSKTKEIGFHLTNLTRDQLLNQILSHQKNEKD